MSTEQAETERERQVQAQTKVLEAEAANLARIVTQPGSRLSDLTRPEAKEASEYPEEALVPYAERLVVVSRSVRESNATLTDLLDVLEF